MHLRDAAQQTRVVRRLGAQALEPRQRRVAVQVTAGELGALLEQVAPLVAVGHPRLDEEAVERRVPAAELAVDGAQGAAHGDPLGLDLERLAVARDRLVALRAVTGRPVGFKAVVGATWWADALFEEIDKRGIESAPDFITVDGAEGGTGAAPIWMMILSAGSFAAANAPGAQVSSSGARVCSIPV